MRLGALLGLAFASLLSTGCAGSRPHAPAGEQITIIEFSVADAVWINYDAPHEPVGMILAEEIAGDLRRRGRLAEAIPAKATPHGDIIVSGRVTRINGGSRAKRALIAMGAGHASFGAEGEARRPDGSKVARFTTERGTAGKGWFGGSNEENVDRCIRRVGLEIAEMIDTGQYEERVPGSRGTASQTSARPEVSEPQAGKERKTEDRLQELQSLRARGLLTEEEYQEKRRRIIEEF